MLEKIQKFAGECAASAASLAKAVIMSRRPFDPGKPKGKGLVIMGNGPSLRKTMDERREWLFSHDLMAVNLFANSEDFPVFKPGNYILADGGLFKLAETDANIHRMWNNLRSCTWPMTLYVPWKHGALAWRLIGGNSSVSIKAYNLTPAEGFGWLRRALYEAGLGMPRPRNVMVPAIMCAIREGYRKIFLTGVDHTWTQTLSVDDENFVVSVQPHFYADNDEEHRRVRAAYAGLHLHDVLGSMTVAFRSYWEILPFARRKGVEIVNCTPGSMIDAFPREKNMQ